MYSFILKNSKFKNLINDIAIDFLSFWNLASVEDVRKKCNPIVDLSKFTFNKKKKMLSGVVTLVYKIIIKFVVKFCSKFNYVEPKII